LRLGLLLLPCLIPVGLWASVGRAAEPGPLGCPIPAAPALDPLPDGTAEDDVSVITSTAEVLLGTSATFDERLVVRSGDRQLAADRARYDQATGEFTVSGNLEFQDPATFVRGDSARYNATTGRFSMEGARYELPSVPARGEAEMLRVDGDQVLNLEGVTYTSCARGKDDWQLKAGSLKVDRAAGTATARNARLEFKDVPILYLPYITYPVDGRRKSGLLLPDFGNSEQRGIEFELPWYWNIAPNYDATLTPHYMSDRGLQAKGEFRYLETQDGWSAAGVLRAETLPNDEVTGDSRSLFGWNHQSALPFGWRGTIDATHVTDTGYFEDLTSGLASTSQTHLRRRVDFEYADPTWSALLRFEDYQTLDETIGFENEPYQRLPQLVVNGFWPNGPLGLEAGLGSELAWFERDTGVTGLRGHLSPHVSLPLQLGPIAVEPHAGFDWTGYQLNDTEPGASDTPARSLPVFSVDMRTLLERAWSGGRWLQTVEPRVQYVHVPFEDQADLPVFDTIEPDFNLVQLFRRNRYVGLDRLSDTDQLSFGVTTRLIRASDGGQFLTATIGETQYFGSRDVVLPGEAPSEDSASDYVAELGMNLDERWNLELGYQWDSDEDVTRLAEARVLYRPDDQRVLNMSYRYRRDSIREIDVAGAWPLGNRWSVVGRFDYSLEDNEPLERFVGLEYATCCWGARVVARRNLSSREGDSDTAITLQLLLKGFGSGGGSAERLLERGILGYDRFDSY
jgi:LPS-assembly protein